MAMITKNTYTTMRELEQWINSFKLPNIQILTSPLTDDITIYNTDKGTSQRISRYALEDAVDPKTIILEAICNIMAVSLNQLGNIIKDAIVTGTHERIVGVGVNGTAIKEYVLPDTTKSGSSGSVLVTDSTGMGTWVSQPSHFPAAVKSIYGIGHVGHTPLTDEEILARDKTFGPYEQAQITAAKNKLKDKYWMYMPSEIMYSKNVVIAGGCFASFLHSEQPHDIDVFILNDQKTKDLVHKHVEQIKTKNPSSDIIKEGNANYMDNDNIEYTAFDMITKIQLITTKFNTRQDLIKHFDMVHCCVSYTPWDDKLFITRDVYDTIMKKTIRSNQKGMMELVKPWRIDKMENQGWVRV